MTTTKTINSNGELIEKVVYDNFGLLKGGQNVVSQLSADNIPKGSVKIFHDGTNVIAVSRIGG